MEALPFSACFLLFLRRQLTFQLLVSVWYFGGVFVWVVFRLGGQADVTPIREVCVRPSSTVANYLPISIAPVLSNVFECLAPVQLGRIMER